MRSRMTAAGASGFTLIELMIVVMIFAGVSSAAFTVYSVQQRSYLRQEQVVEMQQNVRAFLFFIEKDLRIAGYDPKKTAGAGFLTASAAEVAFTADLGRPRSPAVDCAGAGCDSMPDGEISNCSGCVAETIRYALQNDSDGDGLAGAGSNPPTLTTSLTKVFGASAPSSTYPAQPVIDSVEGLEFLYNLNDGTAATNVLAAGKNLADIRSITVSLLVRTRNSLQGYRNTETYYPASNAAQSSTGKKWGPFNDSFMRRLVITNIQCRNMAFQQEE